MISKEELDQFKQIYKKRFNKDLADGVASDKELQRIVKKDYGAEISDEHADTLGMSLLRLAKLALIALARKEEREKKN